MPLYLILCGLCNCRAISVYHPRRFFATILENLYEKYAASYVNTAPCPKNYAALYEKYAARRNQSCGARRRKPKPSTEVTRPQKSSR